MAARPAQGGPSGFPYDFGATERVSLHRALVEGIVLGG